MTSPNERPHVSFAPYLPLRKTYEIGPWVIGPLRNYTGSWSTPEFDEVSRQFLAAFRDSWDQPLRNPTIVATATNGMDGRRPSPQDLRALQSALDFAVIDLRPVADDPNAGHVAATSDNAEIFVWPIDVTDRMVTLERGYLVRSQSGGHKVDASLSIRAPLELQIPIWDLAPDAEILSAVYELATRNPVDDPASHQVIGAIHWLSKAWRNSVSVDFGDRVVLLRNGFEVLSGTDENWACAKWLRRQYEGLQIDDPDEAAAAHLLWSPSETERYEKRIGRREHLHRLTALQDWFMAFGDTRNSIMHGREVTDYAYETEGSPYNGNFVMTGERLLRESIKVCVANMGYPDLWWNDEMRFQKRAVDYLVTHNEATAGVDPGLDHNSSST